MLNYSLFCHLSYLLVDLLARYRARTAETAHDRAVVRGQSDVVLDRVDLTSPDIPNSVVFAEHPSDLADRILIEVVWDQVVH